MKILFYYREGEHLGIGYISAVLKEAGHEVELLFDSGMDTKFGVVKINSFKIKNNNVLLNERLFEKAEEFSPDLMAFSSEPCRLSITLLSHRR